MNFAHGGSKPFRVVRHSTQPSVVKRDKPSDPPDEQPEDFDRWWLASSFDLRHGLEVQETPMDTLPGDLAEDLLSIDLSRLSNRRWLP